ncbi:MAG TPA: glycosyltransferase family 4 protein [Stellaceae bacterium]|jgi:glycosyltransferase involved in cell wall biosynthesis|nr:glycosyltransferase family 4 protein [Stellaceae bacterium]
MSVDIAAAPNGFDLALLSSAQRFVWLRRPDAHGEASPGDPSGLCRFLCWWYRRGIAEYPQFAARPSDDQYAALVAPAIGGSQHAPPISHFLVDVWTERSDLATVFPLVTENGRRSFAEWLLRLGRTEIPLQTMWFDQALREWFLLADPDASPAPRLAVDLWRSRTDLHEIYDLAKPDHRHGLLDWFWAFGVTEHQLDWLRDERPDPGQFIPPCATVRHEMRPLPSPIQDEGVNLIGFASAEFGLGEDLRMAAKALDAAGLPFSIFEVPVGSGVHRGDLSVNRWISDAMPYRTSIFCMAAFETADFYLRYGAAPFTERFVIGSWAWELPDWPVPWMSVFELVDEVWASSRYTQSAFAKATSLPVHFMPMAIDLPRSPPEPRARFALHDGVFQFLLVFDWHSWPARKNPIAAVEAFRLAFPDDSEPVGLAVKMIGVEPWSAEFAAFKALVATDRRITLLSGTMDRPTLAALYRCCDAYVSLHRAEGFGRTLAEAMLAGKPVVATNWSGNRDFLDADTGCPVDYQLRPITAGEYPYSERQIWAEPDLRSAIEWMRWLVADWSRASALGRRGRERIIEQYGVATVGARYAERLHRLWRPQADAPTPPPEQPPKPAARRSRRKAAASSQ